MELSCPVCRIELKQSNRHGVEIDTCPRCRGVWLDRGELDKIMQRLDADPVRLRDELLDESHRPNEKHKSILAGLFSPD